MTKREGFEIVHENAHYVVLIADEVEVEAHGVTFLGAYAVVNKATDMTEYVCTVLPDAIFNAEQFSHALTVKPWEWRKEKEVEEKPAARDVFN